MAEPIGSKFCVGKVYEWSKLKKFANPRTYFRFVYSVHRENMLTIKIEDKAP